MPRLAVPSVRRTGPPKKVYKVKETAALSTPKVYLVRYFIYVLTSTKTEVTLPHCQLPGASSDLPKRGRHSCGQAADYWSDLFQITRRSCVRGIPSSLQNGKGSHLLPEEEDNT